MQAQNISGVGVEDLAQVCERIEGGHLFAQKILRDHLLAHLQFLRDLPLRHAALADRLRKALLYFALNDHLYTPTLTDYTSNGCKNS